MDTRTPRTPTGGRSSSNFDDEPVLSSVKVPCDPAQVIVNHASFRVQLAAPVVAGRLAETTRVPALRGSPPRRRTPVVWSGRTEPGGTAGATTQLLHAVRDASVGLDRGPAEDVGTTQVLPRVRLGGSPASTVVGPRGPADGEDTLPRGTRAVAARLPGQRYDDEDGRDDERFEMRDSYDTGVRRRGGDSVRHAYYPGRRMNLGVVLLPLRIFLGLISVYAGMGKLCDPVYFDGGQRGSMVTWLLSLHPWELAVPLRDFAVAHPVGAGLTVAFLQVVVGVLTICGLWQRVAASFGALLSAALLMTVSWRTLPAYDAPDIIYLAAWSPLIIAGAPVYSMDARLAGEAWRRLGPRVEVGALRRRVLRRGAVMTAVVAGLTLLIGSLLGGAVRTARVPTVPRPGEPAINNLPGSPLPRPGHHAARPGHRIPGHPGAPSTSASHKAHKPGTPSASAPGSPSAGGHTGSSAHRPGATSSAPQLSGPSRTPGRTQSPAGSGGTGGGTSGGSGSGAPGGDSGRGSTLGGLLG